MDWPAHKRQQPTGNQRKNEDALVRYQNPKILSDDSHLHELHTARPGTSQNGDKCTRPSTAMTSGLESSRSCRVNPCGETDTNNQQLEEILNIILPPITWMEDGKTWMQFVAVTPGSRLDVIALEAKLRERLKEHGTLDYGISSVRHELYRECFNELIRQMTITCAERGLLLVRVRDEMDISIDAYRDLFTSEIAFGLRRRLQSATRQSAQLDEFNRALEERQKLITAQKMLHDKLEELHHDIREQNEADESKHGYDLEVLKRINQQIKNQLLKAVAPTYPPLGGGRGSLTQVPVRTIK